MQCATMSRRSGCFRSTGLLLLASGLVGLSGCGQGPSRIEPPDFNPSRAGDLAMEEYDTDGDGYVAGEELENAPGLKAALSTLDQDSDGRVSADEVAARVRSWQDAKTGLTTVNCRVELGGSPLAGAEVTFEPEVFLSDQLPTAVGTTNRFGQVSPVVPADQRPTPDTPPGLPYGLYKVRISKKVNGKEQIPSRYNSETTLGQQVADDEPTMLNNAVVFNLEGK